MSFAKVISVLLLAGWSSTAFAYTPKWLECTGELTIAPANGEATKQAVTDIYVVDSDTQHLFKYFDATQTLSFISANPENNVLKWSDIARTSTGSSWQGQLDLDKMVLSIKETSSDQTRTWTQQCAPTSVRLQE